VKTISTRTAAAAAISMTLAACAASKPVPPPPPTVSTSVAQVPGGGIAEETVTVTATVTAVDQAKRTVTLLGPDGTTRTINVPDEVKNLPQVKRGDLVTATIYESVAYEVRKKGTAEPGVAAAADMATAPVGAMPAAAGAGAITVTATITSIDKQTGTVKLKGPEGNVVPVKVKDESRLDNVRVGDLVDITYTQAVAIAVEKAPKK
jgi:hypothetical protein